MYKYGSVENFVENAENAAYQHFLPYPTYFLKTFENPLSSFNPFPNSKF